MDVATWNVLHRIHAENWGDGPLARFPREAVVACAVVDVDGLSDHNLVTAQIG